MVARPRQPANNRFLGLPNWGYPGDRRFVPRGEIPQFSPANANASRRYIRRQRNAPPIYTRRAPPHNFGETYGGSSLNGFSDYLSFVTSPPGSPISMRSDSRYAPSGDYGNRLASRHSVANGSSTSFSSLSSLMSRLGLSSNGDRSRYGYADNSSSYGSI